MLIRLTTVALLLLAACTPFVPVQQELPEPPKQYQQSGAAAGIELPDRWWTVFADENLNSLQQEMLTGNLDLRQALYRLEQLEALRRTASSGLWPSLNANATASREQTPTATGNITSTTSRGSLVASYEIDLWNRLHDKEKATELRLLAGEKETQTLLLSLTAQLAESYFQALEKNAQIKLLEQQIDRSQKLLATASDRYRAGLATADEIYQAEAELMAQQARLPQLQTALIQSKQAIALLLGRHLLADFNSDTKLPQLSQLVRIGLPASLLNNRPDVAAAFMQLQATDHELAAALAARLPTVSLTASFGYSATRLARGDIEGIFWGLAASLAQPLFDGGRRQAEADRQQAIRDEQLSNTREVLLKAVQDVETALVADRNCALRSTQLNRQQQAVEQRLELSRSNYRSGLINSSALLNAELQQLNLRSQQLSAQREWLSSRISLARSLGGRWMSEELRNQQQTLNATEDK